MPPATTTSCGRPESSFCRFLALGNTALGGRPPAQRRLRNAARRRLFRPAPCRGYRYVSPDPRPVALVSGWPMAAARSREGTRGPVRESSTVLHDNGVARRRRTCRQSNAGQPFRLARKGFSHGRSRQSSVGPEPNRDRGEGRIPDFPVTRSHPPASWPSAANSSICRTYRKTAGEESRRRSPVANRWMRP